MPLTEGVEPTDELRPWNWTSEGTTGITIQNMPVNVSDLPPPEDQTTLMRPPPGQIGKPFTTPQMIQQAFGGDPSTAWAFNLAKTPSDAPKSIDLSAFNGTFQSLMAQSFPNVTPLEDGATFFGDSFGHLTINNLGGLDRDNGSFNPDLSPPSSALDLFGLGPTAIGDFHTHPYGTSDTATNDSEPFSGDDIAVQINSGQNFAVVQSDGGNQWLLLRTQETPSTQIDPTTEFNSENQAAYALENQGVSREPAYMQVVTAAAQKYNMVLYQGQNGVFHRVN